MRLVGVFILAFVASVIAGLLVYAAASFLPDWDDPAARNPAEVFRAVLTLAYVIPGMVLYGVAVWRRDRNRHIKHALYVLLLVPFLIVLLGLADTGIHDVQWLRETVGMVQMFTPLWTVALVQWLILHIYLSRQTMFAKAASR